MKRLFTAAIALFISFNLHSQVTVRGLVTDSERGLKIPDAAVIVDGEKGFTTLSDGSFVFSDIQEGRHTIEVKMVGYKKWSDLFEGFGTDTLIIEAKLLADVVESEEIVVS